MDTTGWRRFRLEDLFTSFERGKVHSQNNLPIGSSYFYVGAKKNRCGVIRKCGYERGLVSKGNCIIFICNGEGSVGYSNYMDRDFMASGDLILGYAEFLNPTTALFIVTMLDRERPKYSFGRKYGKYINKTTIPLPVNQDGINPDWQYINDFVENHLNSLLPTKTKMIWNKTYDTNPKIDENIEMSDRIWKKFKVSDIFDEPYKALANNAINLQPCSPSMKNAIPYITRTDDNNGCKFFVQKTKDLIGIEDGNAITIGDTTATIYYQANKFICGDHIVILRSKYLNVFRGLFIVSLLNKERFRYNYGRAFNKKIIENTTLHLPVEEGSGRIDWKFMEDFIKSLPFSVNLI